MKILLLSAICITTVAATDGFWWEKPGRIGDDSYGSSGKQNTGSSGNHNTGSSGGAYGGGSDGAETFGNANSAINQNQNTGGSYAGGSSGSQLNNNAGGGYTGGNSGSNQNQNVDGSHVGGSNQNQNTGGNYGGGSTGNQQNQNIGGSHTGSSSGGNQNLGGNYGAGSSGSNIGGSSGQQSGSYGSGSSSGSSGYVDNTIGQQNHGQGTCRHQCVPYFQCNSGEIIDDGEGIIDLRIYEPGQDADNSDLVGGSCPNILDVCCRNPNLPEPVPITPAPYRPTQCGHKYDQSQDQVPDVRIHLNKSLHNFDNVAQFGAYPWMAAILKFDKYGDQDLNVYQCGGSLIDQQVILTAAHCVDNLRAEQLKVRLGEWDTQSTQDHPNFYHEDYYVSKIVTHSRYYRKNVFNDIALIFLSKPVTLNYHIQTICLPRPGQQFEGQTCYASGWGKDNFGQEGNWQAILKEIDVPVVDRSRCQETLRTSRLGCNFCLHDTFLCAGGIEGKDTCTGDGGSPLVCVNNYDQSFIQAGIVSWGIGCGSALPAVYVDVARYVDWIDYQINEYFTKPYTGAYKSASGGVTEYYEGDQLFTQCKTTPRAYPVGHYCYRAPRPRPQQHRRPNPRPGAGRNPYPAKQSQGGSYGSNSNQGSSGNNYSQGQQQDANAGSGYSGQGQQQEKTGSSYSNQGQQQNTGVYGKR